MPRALRGRPAGDARWFVMEATWPETPRSASTPYRRHARPTRMSRVDRARRRVARRASAASRCRRPHGGGPTVDDRGPAAGPAARGPTADGRAARGRGPHASRPAPSPLVAGAPVAAPAARRVGAASARAVWVGCRRGRSSSPSASGSAVYASSSRDLAAQDAALAASSCASTRSVVAGMRDAALDQARRRAPSRTPRYAGRPRADRGAGAGGRRPGERGPGRDAERRRRPARRARRRVVGGLRGDHRTRDECGVAAQGSPPASPPRSRAPSTPRPPGRPPRTLASPPSRLPRPLRAGAGRRPPRPRRRRSSPARRALDDHVRVRPRVRPPRRARRRAVGQSRRAARSARGPAARARASPASAPSVPRSTPTARASACRQLSVSRSGGLVVARDRHGERRRHLALGQRQHRRVRQQRLGVVAGLRLVAARPATTPRCGAPTSRAWPSAARASAAGSTARSSSAEPPHVSAASARVRHRAVVGRLGAGDAGPRPCGSGGRTGADVRGARSAQGVPRGGRWPGRGRPR